MSVPGHTQYPAMLPTESAIWSAFLAKHGSGFTSIDYNVRIGVGFDPGPGVPDYARKAAIANTQLRIDAVAYDGTSWWLIEIKRRAGAGALGQLLQYAVLYETDYPKNSPLQLAIVTNYAKLGLQALCDRHKIQLYIIGL